MSAALVIQHAMRMRRIVTCGLSGYTTFLHIITQMLTILWKKYIEHKMCFFYFLYNFFSWNIYHFKKSWGNCYDKCT